MPQLILYLDDKEDKIVEKFSKKWGTGDKKMSKHEVIKKIIKKFKEEKK